MQHCLLLMLGMSKNENYKGNSVMLTHTVTPTMHGRFGESQSFSLGTPVLLPEIEYLNSCLSLPDANKFASGVSELIMHNNLPNTTGTFKKLKLVFTEQKRHLGSGSCNDAPLNNWYTEQINYFLCCLWFYLQFMQFLQLNCQTNKCGQNMLISRRPLAVKLERERGMEHPRELGRKNV